MHERRVALLMNRDSSPPRGVCRSAGVRRRGRPLVCAPVTIGSQALNRSGMATRWRHRPLVQRRTGRWLGAWGGPVVNITSTLNDPRFPMVEVKHDAVGVMAAEHLLERGFRHRICRI